MHKTLIIYYKIFSSTELKKDSITGMPERTWNVLVIYDNQYDDVRVIWVSFFESNPITKKVGLKKIFSTYLRIGWFLSMLKLLATVSNWRNRSSGANISGILCFAAMFTQDQEISRLLNIKWVIDGWWILFFFWGHVLILQFATKSEVHYNYPTWQF